MTDYDEFTLREILANQAETSRALKRARAQLVLDYAHLKQAEMWAHVELGTITEADAADRADVEAKILWAAKGFDIASAQQSDT
jgi:hypothetical protein